MRTKAQETTSDCSEKLFQKVVIHSGYNGFKIYFKINVFDLGEGGVHIIKYISYRRFSANHETLMSP